MLACSFQAAPPNLERFREASDQFSLEIYNKVSQSNVDKNIFLSPLSIQSALLLTYMGADGTTKAEIEKGLKLHNFAGYEKALLDVYGEVLRVFVPSKDEDGKVNYELALANRAYLRKGLHIKGEFKSAVKEKLNSEVSEADFQHNNTGAVSEINRWVEQQTHNKIKDLVSTDSVTPDTVFVLVNAIYFKSDWLHRFNPDAVFQADFTTFTGRTSRIDYMNTSDDFPYMENDSFQLLMMPYKNKELSMIIVLPKERNGLKTVEGRLSAEVLREACKEAQEMEVLTTIPKFKLEQSYELVPVLATLGVKELFKDADLSRMVDGQTQRVAVSNVIHKAFVEVNESGTEAAAATAVVAVAYCSMSINPKPPPVFHANHPFLFAIRHESTGLIVFMGRVGML